jgi:hypothetical protein
MELSGRSGVLRATERVRDRFLSNLKWLVVLTVVEVSHSTLKEGRETPRKFNQPL